MTLEIIAMLEAATEGSRELDGNIVEAINEPSLQRAQAAYLNTLRREKNRKGYAAVDRGRWERSTPTHFCWDAPHYTTSLDAALTLVPATLGIMWNVAKYPGESAAAYVGQRDVRVRQFLIAKTPALALCIAALKARTEMMFSKGASLERTYNWP